MIFCSIIMNEDEKLCKKIKILRKIVEKSNFPYFKIGVDEGTMEGY